MYNCDSLRCESLQKLCCRRYHVEISAEETAAIEQIFPQIQKHNDLEQISRINRIFKMIDADTFEIAHSALKNACYFLAINSVGNPICAIQSTCTQLGLDYQRYKPLACRIFPLEIYFEDLSALHLILHSDADKFPCLSVEASESGETIEDLIYKEFNAAVTVTTIYEK